jgi:Kef-type K+ transport system membrane component KefB
MAGLAYGGSALLAIACAYALTIGGPSSQPLFLAIVLMSTSAGLLLPLLTDAGEEKSQFGQLVMTAGALAEVVTIILLSLFFTAGSKTPEARVAAVAVFLALLIVSGLALARVRRLEGLERMLDRLDDRSAQLRVRAALTLALAFGVLAYSFGFASILGAFAAGLLVRMIDLSGHAPHPQFEVKLQGIGFGFLIPIFFIATGVQFDLQALLRSPTALAEVPLFLVALLVVRGLPALAYRRRVGLRRAFIAGLMQATTLTFVIVATKIGVATELISSTTSASLLAAGLLSAALFPAAALWLMAPAQPAPGFLRLGQRNERNRCSIRPPRSADTCDGQDEETAEDAGDHARHEQRGEADADGDQGGGRGGSEDLASVVHDVEDAEVLGARSRAGQDFGHQSGVDTAVAVEGETTDNGEGPA